MHDEQKTIAEYFNGYFEGSYDGSYGTPRADAPRDSFLRLTDCHIIWSQVHGSYKDKAKMVDFVPYQYWPELYECCAAIVRQWANDTVRHYWCGPATGARIMEDAMRLLKSRHGYNTPKWWIPCIRQMRGEITQKGERGWNPAQNTLRR